MITMDKVKFSLKDIRDKLIPVLKNSVAPEIRLPIIQEWAQKLVDECRSALSMVLPFRSNEIEFLNQLQQEGKIRPELISEDKILCERISKHPLLHWRGQVLKSKT